MVSNTQHICPPGTNEFSEYITRATTIHLSTLQWAHMSTYFQCSCASVHLIKYSPITKQKKKKQGFRSIHNNCVKVSFPVTMMSIKPGTMWEFRGAYRYLFSEAVIAVDKKEYLSSTLWLLSETLVIMIFIHILIQVLYSPIF
jgi:hypothetical protein